MPSTWISTATWTIIRDELLWPSRLTKMLLLNTIELQQTGCDVRQPGRPCYNWVTGGKTALSWLHNYHDLLLWSIAEQAVSRATINHCYLHRNKSWGAIIGNHNSYEPRFIITHLWLFRYITKVSQKGKKMHAASSWRLGFSRQASKLDKGKKCQV